MSINGSRGRAKAAAAYRRELQTLARSCGVDPADRMAVRQLQFSRTTCLTLGISDRIACGCQPEQSHRAITGADYA